tara:strand:+ start:384 stop:893 length:510 start_codon:yes stop_codon:yes gene_type:complete
MKNIIKTLLLVLATLSTSAFSEEIADKNRFLMSGLDVKELPGHSYIIINEDIQDNIKKILKDTYHLPIIKYWKAGNKVGFVLEAIGKHEFITTGYIVENNKIIDAKVLVYRENYGYEIEHDYFLDQIRGNSVKKNGKLVKSIANISGATLSVKAMRKLSKLSLYLYTII